VGAAEGEWARHVRPARFILDVVDHQAVERQGAHARGELFGRAASRLPWYIDSVLVIEMLPPARRSPTRRSMFCSTSS
jgi:hypothetical protein